jgi:hypothetical protein
MYRVSVAAGGAGFTETYLSSVEVRFQHISQSNSLGYVHFINLSVFVTAKSFLL